MSYYYCNSGNTMNNSNNNKDKNQSSSVHQPEAVNLNVPMTLNLLGNLQKASMDNRGNKPKIGSSSSVDNAVSLIIHENPTSNQSTYDHQNKQHGDQDLRAIIRSNPGSHSTHLPSSNQPIHCPRPQNPPRRVEMPTPTPVDSVHSCQIGVIQPSASICGRRCHCAAVLVENVQLRSEVASLEADLANVKSRLEKLEKEVVLKPSDGEQSKPKRARSKKDVAPFQDNRPNMKKPHPGRSSSLKDDKVQHKSGQKASQVTATSQHKVVRRTTDLNSNNNNPGEASSSNPAAHGPGFLESMQANVGSRGTVFRQRRREVVNVVENLNEVPAQAESAQHEEADDAASTSAQRKIHYRNSRPKFFEE